MPVHLRRLASCETTTCSSRVRWQSSSSMSVPRSTALPKTEMAGRCEGPASTEPGRSPRKRLNGQGSTHCLKAAMVFSRFSPAPATQDSIRAASSPKMLTAKDTQQQKDTSEGPSPAVTAETDMAQNIVTPSFSTAVVSLIVLFLVLMVLKARVGPLASMGSSFLLTLVLVCPFRASVITVALMLS